MSGGPAAAEAAGVADVDGEEGFAELGALGFVGNDRDEDRLVNERGPDHGAVGLAFDFGRAPELDRLGAQAGYSSSIWSMIRMTSAGGTGFQSRSIIVVAWSKTPQTRGFPD